MVLFRFNIIFNPTSSPTSRLPFYRPGGEGRAGRPVESPPGLVNGTGQFFPDDDRYSLDSRSLTAFSNYSERDSVTTENGYRCVTRGIW
jgi:hypothetical protein